RRGHSVDSPSFPTRRSSDRAPGDISVGQSIEAFGTATPVSSSAMAGDWTIDASAGRVRMRETPIYGFVKQGANGSLTLQLDSIRSEEHTSELHSLTNPVCRL